MTNTKYQTLWCTFLKTLEQACYQGQFKEAEALISSAMNDYPDLGEIDARLTRHKHNIALDFHARHQRHRAELVYRQHFDLSDAH
jgi:hypothetical protein